MKKILLPESGDYDIRLAGIVSVVPLYRLVWLINNHLQLDLALSDDRRVSLPAGVPGEEPSLHTCYTYNDKALELQWSLIRNRGTASILLRTRPLSDYVLVMKGEDYDRSFERCTRELLSINDVTAVLPVDFSSLKDIDNYL